MVRGLLPTRRAPLTMSETVRLEYNDHGCTAHVEIGIVGAGIREYVCCDRVIVPMDTVTARRNWYSGTTLAPWPNRLAGGAWTADGVLYEGQCNDNGRHALHGLVYNAEFRVERQSPAAVTLAFDLGDDAIYPFAVRISVAYALTARGLDCGMTATNRSDERVPIALGAHPYFPFDATTTLVTTAQHYAEVGAGLIPTGHMKSVDTLGLTRGGETQLDGLVLDNCFAGMSRDASGRAETALHYADGSITAIWQDRHLEYLQMFTKPDFPWAAGVSGAIGIEPQTAPPNAFNSGDGVRWLSPGEEFVVQWGIEVR